MDTDRKQKRNEIMNDHEPHGIAYHPVNLLNGEHA